LATSESAPRNKLTPALASKIVADKSLEIDMLKELAE
jgi:hypothetical protein